jgi:hypothetical protein
VVGRGDDGGGELGGGGREKEGERERERERGRGRLCKGMLYAMLSAI